MDKKINISCYSLKERSYVTLFRSKRDSGVSQRLAWQSAHLWPEVHHSLCLTRENTLSFFEMKSLTLQAHTFQSSAEREKSIFGRAISSDLSEVIIQEQKGQLLSPRCTRVHNILYISSHDAK